MVELLDEIDGIELDLELELEKNFNHPPPSYSEQSYWNDRFSKSPDEFDWYFPFSKIKDSIYQIIPRSETALNLGCDNSPMTLELLTDGFSHVRGINFPQS
jgi:hypothetical protein